MRYQFATWAWDYERLGVCHGHYYEGNFCGAKQDFSVRSGLISRAHLFTPEELTELYRATDYLLEEEPESGQMKAIQTARTKIEYIYGDPGPSMMGEKTPGSVPTVPVIA